MRTTISLLRVYIIAIAVALTVTLVEGDTLTRTIALAVVTPQIIFLLLIVRACNMGRVWGFAGGGLLGGIGVVLRVAVSMRPSLEVGGGLPAGVSALYITLGSLVCLRCYESVLELRE